MRRVGVGAKKPENKADSKLAKENKELKAEIKALKAEIEELKTEKEGSDPETDVETKDAEKPKK